LSNEFASLTERLVTAPEWRTTAGHVGELINLWSGRRDLIAIIGTTAGDAAGAAAAFFPNDSRVEVNTSAAFGEKTKPKAVGDLRERNQQYAWPTAIGAVWHESQHAKYTTWDIKLAQQKLTPLAFKALMLLEETRMEGLGIAAMPKMQVFMRSAVFDLVLHDTPEEMMNNLSGVRSAARIAGLIAARVDIGVLEMSDAEDIITSVTTILGADLYNKLRALWRTFQGYNAPTLHIDSMYKAAQKWSELVEAEAKARGEDEDKPADDIPDWLRDLLKALGKSQKKTAVRSSDQAKRQQTQENHEKSAKKKAEKEKEQDAAKKQAKQVFNNPNSKPNPNGTQARLQVSRKPTTEEQRAAVTVGKMWNQAKYRDRLMTPATAATPPGRLRTRSLVQAAAYRAAGVNTEVEPFRRNMYKHVEDPNLSVGVMVDVSGSMARAMVPMGATAYVLSEAARLINGKAALVYYGASVISGLKPGETQETVHIYNAPDSYEAFTEGFQALDGGLNLLNGTGARLLVVVSDGAYKTGQVDAVPNWLTRCRESGVGVLWIGYGTSDSAKGYCTASGFAEFILPTGAPTDDALQIGRAGARALTTASAT
jgi:Sec-independent protein translocase protein TatA